MKKLDLHENSDYEKLSFYQKPVLHLHINVLFYPNPNTICFEGSLYPKYSEIPLI